MKEIYNYYGAKPEHEILGREAKKEATPRAEKARQMYFDTKSSVSVEFPYWYTRRWEELDGEVQIIKRAEALKEAFEHLTPAILPGELLVMRKANYLRGSFPMPWISEGFFLSKEDDLFIEIQNAGKASADEVTTIGQGGGNVTKSVGNVISIAGKFGLRKEEMPILIKIAKKWFNKSVDDIGHKYEQLVPGYSTKEEIMRAVICMFDSGYTLPQGREVINYYYPLRYGIEGIKNICKEKQAKAAGVPNMNRIYFYQAVHTMLEGLQTWILNYAKEAIFVSDLKTGKVLRSTYLPADKFGEGIAILNNKITQLTYKSMEGYIYDQHSFSQIKKFNYSFYTEGWGITTDEKDFIMSNGTDKIYVLDSAYYSLIKEITVCDNKEPIDSLNELEYVHGFIYSNIWMSNKIAQIDYKTGKVLGYLDLTAIIPKKYRNHHSDVLNGIAYNDENNSFLITGKHWEKIYEIKIED